MYPVSETEDAILDALAEYQFLTAKQMLTLNVTSDRSHLYATLQKLKGRRPAPIKSLSFGSIPGRGRLADIVYLTAAGGELIEERERGQLQVKTHRKPVFRNDYDHRIGCVDFQIALTSWASAERQTIDFFETYYDPVTGGGRGIRTPLKTAVRYSRGTLVPDAVFALSDEHQVRRLCVFELYCGRRTKRVWDQLHAYFQALDEDAIEERYHYSAAARILLVFDEEKDVALVQSRLKGHPKIADYGERFYLATQASVAADMRHAWQSFAGAPQSLL